METATPEQPMDADAEQRRQATGPAISVVVSTYERRGRLRQLVGALERQTVPAADFEVVIVDDGSTDGSFEELQRLAAATRLDLRPVRLDQNGGPAAGRNVGWRTARAPIIAFTDDDCEPQPDWLQRGLDAMERGNVVAVGRTLPNPAQRNNLGPFSRTLTVNDTRFLQTCNVFYRRADLEAVGGFDESFRTKNGEDTDLGWRVADRGNEIVFAEDALVYHDISTSDYRAALRAARGWTNVARVRATHPERAKRNLHHGIFWKKSHPPVIVAIGGLMLAVALRRPVLVLAVAPWVRFRLARQPVARRRFMRVLLLPHVFLIDATEVATMVRGSVRHRVVVL